MINKEIYVDVSGLAGHGKSIVSQIISNALSMVGFDTHLTTDRPVNKPIPDMPEEYAMTRVYIVEKQLPKLVADPLQKYKDRTFNEWKQHGKIIICVDFDNTISPYDTFQNDDDIEQCIKLLRECQQVGCYIVIHTACNPDRHLQILTWCSSIGVNVDCINRTPIEMQYGKPGSKPYANIFLDDRAGLLQSMEILSDAMYRMRAHKAAENTSFDI